MIRNDDVLREISQKELFANTTKKTKKKCLGFFLRHDFRVYDLVCAGWGFPKVTENTPTCVFKFFPQCVFCERWGFLAVLFSWAFLYCLQNAFVELCGARGLQKMRYRKKYTCKKMRIFLKFWIVRKKRVKSTRDTSQHILTKTLHTFLWCSY